MIKRLNAWQYLVLSFAVLILFGTFLLSLPLVEHEGGLTFTDALFTATSAVCVTGLTTVSTSGFNLAGQLILLLLMQLGAIGIMTLTSSFLLAVRGKVGLRRRFSFSSLQDNYELRDAHGILASIVKITIAIELVGFVLLSVGFWWEGFDVRRALYEGFFHAISAFCNAGFSTFDESLINSNALVKYTVGVLVIMGGLGYFVIYETMERYKSGRRFSLHSKVVLVTSGFLVVAGMFLLYLFEQGSVSITDCFFQSVTTRTAGFNSVDLTEISYAGIFLLTILMFIGASPGSTGGGIKTTTFFVIVVSIFSVLKGRTSVVVFKRSIPLKMILKSFATALVYIAIIAIGAILLLQDERIEFESAIFEVVSAMGTVGLSLGVTPQLSEFGKIVIILLMFIGRLGPASFALATLTKQKELKIKYPEGTLY